MATAACLWRGACQYACAQSEQDCYSGQRTQPTQRPPTAPKTSVHGNESFIVNRDQPARGPNALNYNHLYVLQAFSSEWVRQIVLFAVFRMFHAMD